MNRRDRGQATVELALTLPLLCVLLLGVVQVAVVARDRLAVQLAAREAARAAAASSDPAAAMAAAPGRGRARSAARRMAESAGRVRATVTYVERTDVPLIGVLLPDLTVTATRHDGRRAAVTAPVA